MIKIAMIKQVIFFILFRLPFIFVDITITHENINVNSPDFDSGLAKKEEKQPLLKCYEAQSSEVSLSFISEYYLL